MKPIYRKTLVDLLTVPTAPLCEEYVVGYIRRWADQRPGIEFKQDEYGNIRLRVKRGSKPAAAPMLFSAHMDHPGFEAEKMIGPRQLKAVWRGWVAPEYFKGTGVRFFSDGRWVRGTIKSTKTGVVRGRLRVLSALAEVKTPVEPGSIGMWDLPDPAVRGKRIFARGCDDVGGVAAVLCALEELARGRGPVEAYALLTRAEEVGWAGAIAACKSGIIPRRTRIIAVETSSEIPGVQMGNGPILRVGDSLAIFPNPLCAHTARVAKELAKRRGSFKWQRKLMDGGSTESLAYLEYGHESIGMCLALGNYHNMDRIRKRIGAEHIDLSDFEALVKWFVALAKDRRPSLDHDPAVRRVIAKQDRTWSAKLKRTRGRIGGQ
ncbi:MAG TPA: M20/M25/M40 family metallo-hydrolase [Phycisphaerae bacterium]|nr:M20/M25/M40 family metallo-hydrolase [Phycisphaerae bacterium]HRY69991.1 M20/M25/M40 family metallo-hydrolase [Phycisphaerae bacterium]HSA27200.1 M20/M25/M40 family metallo-hydrolase [Phycisphaerae bacterium]